ncbi:lanthionine synthetase LanC family protein [Nonomuraea ferruginea]
MRPQRTRADSPLTAAISAGRWIRSAAVDDDHGRHWLANPDARGRSAVTPEPSSLYSGAAGIVLFFLELAAATGHEAYLEDARVGARRLAATWREQRDPTLYHGLTGTMVALMEAGWALGDDLFEVEAAAIADELVRRGREGGDGVGWSREPAQRGDGGIVLGLLRAAAHFGAPAYEEAAVEAGLRIAALPVPGHRFGDCADLPLDAVTPGFLVGTAGTAFLLARLYGVTGEEVFLRAARRGAGFVRELSVVTGQCAVVPHHVPQARQLHYLGFCSGSARRGADVLRAAPGGRRPGRPGVGGAARERRGTERSAAPPHRRVLERGLPVLRHGGPGRALRRPVGGDRAARAPDLRPLAGRRPDQPGHRPRRAGLPLVSGLPAAAARRGDGRHRLPGRRGGIGAALLHLDAVEHARRVILLPDNPFPAIPVPPAAL